MKSKNSFTQCLSPHQLIELDACTQCGECLRYCPVQEVTGNPSISPPEKIRMFREFIKATSGLRASLFGPRDIDRKLLEDFVKAVYECTACGACGQHCTVGIFTQRLWPMLRREMVRRGLGPLGPQANLSKIIAKTGNPYDKPADERFSPWFPESVRVSEKADIGYYAGCTSAYEAQPMVKGDVVVLGAAKEPFTMLPPEEEVCCGFPLFITGQHDMLEDLTKRLVNAYEARGVKVLICSCPCCVNIMARDWPIFYGQELPFKIRHISQFAADALQKGRLTIKGELNERLIYHDPCYLSRGVGIIEEPRMILRSIPGVHLLEFERHGLDSRCCGAGGAARKVFHENAIAIGRLTIDEAVEKKADRLVINCPACYAKMHEAMQGHDKQIRITDIMELLGSLAGGGTS
ncbi:MAG TPA: (Fe-S)-binding protein [Thermodesulfovibrionales bacterium]|nr:(Fe-S)-binding protein [Thermodesulfovibrionales bacterium]